MEARTVTAEDYLKSLDEFTLYKGFASLSDIAHLLNTTRQSAYDEIKILLQKGFVIKQDRGKYVLSPAGQQAANLFLRKHRIAEILLWKGLSMKWEQIDDQAMGIEHGITEDIARAVCQKFGCETCPHGNPVPDIMGNVSEINDLTMDELLPGKSYKISRVIFENREILEFLGQNSLLPGAIVYTDEQNALHDRNYRDRVIPKPIGKALRYLIYEA